jgi:hypothetical protein
VLVRAGRCRCSAVSDLAYIRSGSGHLDLANALSGTAALYGQHLAVIKGDTKNYRDTDAAQAIAAREDAAKNAVLSDSDEVTTLGVAASLESQRSMRR